MTDLITLTASDLDGCRNIEDCFVVYESGRTSSHTMSSFSILMAAEGLNAKCHPHDYIRAWLGPRTGMLNNADHVKIFRHDNIPFLLFTEGVCEECLPCESQYFQYADCPPALASAMGDSVWVRGEDGWEVRK